MCPDAAAGCIEPAEPVLDGLVHGCRRVGADE